VAGGPRQVGCGKRRRALRGGGSAGGTGSRGTVKGRGCCTRSPVVGTTTRCPARRAPLRRPASARGAARRCGASCPKAARRGGVGRRRRRRRAQGSCACGGAARAVWCACSSFLLLPAWDWVGSWPPCCRSARASMKERTERASGTNQLAERGRGRRSGRRRRPAAHGGAGAGLVHSGLHILRAAGGMGTRAGPSGPARGVTQSARSAQRHRSGGAPQRPPARRPQCSAAAQAHSGS
jgi:hypothetical protein